MVMNGNKVRKYVYVTPEVNEYLEKQAESFGMSVSGYIMMCISQIRQQSEIASVMMDMKDMITDLKAIELKQKFK